MSTLQLCCAHWTERSASRLAFVAWESATATVVAMQRPCNRLELQMFYSVRANEWRVMHCLALWTR
eukprot:4704457-Karenia_brevis.AAC.1